MNLCHWMKRCLSAPFVNGSLLAVGLAGVIPAPVKAQSFDGLGFLAHGPNQISYAWGVSGNGAVAIGISSSTPLIGRNLAFRWTREGGMQSLGGLSETGNSSASAANVDGTIIVGGSFTPEGYRAFRWSEQGMENLGVLPGTAESSAVAVSADGSVIVGYSAPSFTEFLPRAFRWTRADGMQDIGTLPGGTYAEARGVSGDGSIIVGVSGSPSGDRAFLWTSAGGMEDLGVLPGGNASFASAISVDGSVVVGRVEFEGFHHRAFRWTREGGMEELGSLPGGEAAWANAVSRNGNAIVGIAYDATPYPRAVAWLRGGGVIQLDSYLSAFGLDLSGWSLQQSFGVSYDGATFCGGGFSPAALSASEAWVGTFPVPPGCVGDFNVDAQVNSQDFFDFVTAFFAGERSADVNGSGTIDSADFFAFLESFFTGCA